jgi:ribosomal protein S12 methylthiotransferase accessory factor
MIPHTITSIDTTYKDDSPRNTVAKIQGILDRYGIETSEYWFDSGVPGCYSVRVSVVGTVFGTNGKGVTEDLARASGYGELMERLQIGRIFKGDRQKIGDIYSNKKSERTISAQELLQRNKAWYTLLASATRKMTGEEVTEEDLLTQYTDKNGNVGVTSFYCINKKREEYLPTGMLNIYGTNGCAAGNTMEEAVVQAISEIVERSFSSWVLAERIAIPDIPESVLRSYPLAYSIISFLREHHFKVVVKDCSLGTKFPVICVCLIDQKTGKYHTHFGAFPIFEIALNRTLTESFQGRSIQKIAQFEDFFSDKDESFDLGNLLNQLCKGTSEKSPDFFLSSAQPSDQVCSFAGRTNRELLLECVDFLCDQGYDILIRDYSCLGFPTYQVIIPGYSETFVHRLLQQHNDVRYGLYPQVVLRNPAAATAEELLGYQMHLMQSSKQKLGPSSFTAQANLPLQLEPNQESYLMSASMAYVNYSLGRYPQTIKFINMMLRINEESHPDLLICLKRYLTLQAEKQAPARIREILEYFHSPDTVQYLFDCIQSKKNPLDRFVLHCDLQCDPSCKIHGMCLKKQTDALSQMIETKQQEVDQSQLQAKLAALS